MGPRVDACVSRSLPGSRSPARASCSRRRRGSRASSSCSCRPTSPSTPREAEETLALHPYAADYLGVYEAAGLVGPRTIFAHAIHLSESEWDRVAARGAAIAHCPDSNAFLGSGRMRLGEARRRGIAVGLGSDVAAGRSFDMRRALSHAYDAALATGAPAGAAELFELATLGGARALHLADVAGALTAGRDADFVVLHRPAHAAGEDGALRIATFAADVAPVLRTYVRGRLVWQRDAAF
jgi:guanine deaminase